MSKEKSERGLKGPYASEIAKLKAEVAGLIHSNNALVAAVQDHERRMSWLETLSLPVAHLKRAVDKFNPFTPVEK